MATVNPEWLATARAFAEALGKLKAKHEQGQGVELTPQEVEGILWAIRNLRGASRDTANPA